MTRSHQDVGQAIKRFQVWHQRRANQLLRERAHLSLAQYDVLRHLHTDPDVTLRELAVATHQTDQSAGELARRMTERGLLMRVTGPGRAVQHQVTALGRSAFLAGSDVMDGVLAESIGVLPPDDVDRLLTLLRKIPQATPPRSGRHRAP